MMDEYCTQELVKRREELKIDLNRTICERNSALEELARVTEERDNLQAKLDEAVDKALALAKERDALQDKLERSIELPLDADGVPIRVGDVIQFVNEQGGTGAKVEVCATSEHYAYYGEGKHFYKASMCRHVKPDPLKELLTEMLDRNSDGVGMREFNRDFDAFVAHYADEIRELLGGDAE